MQLLDKNRNLRIGLLGGLVDGGLFVQWVGSLIELIDGFRTARAGTTDRRLVVLVIGGVG